MFFTIKLKWIVACLAVLVAGVTILSAHVGNNAVGTSVSQGAKTILIDAGHGYPDGGARGASGVYEKDLNLKVAFLLKNLLEQEGFCVVMTRVDDNGLHDEKVSNKKRSDLNKRVRMMSETNADLFVSIHMNLFSESKYSGAQVFYSKSNKQSTALGKVVQKELIEIVDKTNTREAKEAYDSIFVLKQAKIPAILVECGFLSNPEEEKLLQQDEYQSKVAEAIKGGIVKYYQNAGQATNEASAQTVEADVKA